MNVLQTSLQLQSRKRVLAKTVEDARPVRQYKTRPPGIAQGSADPCVFTRQRKIAISSRRLDTALLCAAKKRGVEKGPAGRSLPEPPPGPWTTGPVKKPLAAAGSKKRHPLSWMPSLFEVKKLSLRELRRAASCLQAVFQSSER